MGEKIWPKIFPCVSIGYGFRNNWKICAIFLNFCNCSCNNWEKLYENYEISTVNAHERFFFTIFFGCYNWMTTPTVVHEPNQVKHDFYKKIEEISKIILYEYWYFLRSTILKSPRSNLNLDNRLFRLFFNKSSNRN